MGKKRKSAKDVMLPHSAAKVAFYRSYLVKMLSIISAARYYNRVNIFDVFCGRGVYADGGHGSPIQAMEAIQKVREDRPSDTTFYLYLNDVVKKFVLGVKEYIEEHFPKNGLCKVKYLNAPAKRLFEELVSFLEHMPKTSKNVIFIDPYGYKDIHKETLRRMMSNERTEILLFLPISFMHRFTHYAFDGNANKGALPLREFISEFFPVGHPVRSDEPMDVKQYIRELTKAFSFDGKYYTTSYFIERDSKNYFALFFMTTNLLGLEKAVDTLWELDKLEGKGFHLPEVETSQLKFFEDFFREEDNRKRFEYLRILMLSFLEKRQRSNCEIYEYILQHGYKPTHANEVLRKLQKDDLIDVFLWDSGNKAKKGAFYVCYTHSKNRNMPKAVIGLK
jgi:three-Cys-motif partner protein